MADPLPKFDEPPVVETVLSLQFESLPNFTSAFAGWFWKDYMRDVPGNWTKAVDAPRLDDQNELFGDEEIWGHRALKISNDPRSRVQIVREDEQRMIQIQDSRLVLNWKKEQGIYPSYQVLVREFNDLLVTFRRFAQEAGCGDLKPNQWEVTYVNFLYKGDIWNTPGDMAAIFNQIHAPAAAINVTAEAVGGSWRYVIGDRRGRLHVTLQRVRTQPDDKEALRFQFTARGPVSGEWNQSHFDLGHETIVRSFASMTTDRAHKAWKRTQ